MTPYIKDEIKRDEGLRLKAYPDPESPLALALRKPLAERPDGWAKLSGAPWTCGFGCTGPGIGPNTIWTQAEADEVFEQKFDETLSLLDHHLFWWRTLDDVRQDVLVNMTFNMGVGNDLHGLLSFHHFLRCLHAGDYTLAANEMAASRWANQVKSRAQRLALMMRTGVSQTVH